MRDREKELRNYLPISAKVSEWSSFCAWECVEIGEKKVSWAFFSSLTKFAIAPILCASLKSLCVLLSLAICVRNFGEKARQQKKLKKKTNQRLVRKYSEKIRKIFGNISGRKILQMEIEVGKL